jgi:hypothetical protein
MAWSQGSKRRWLLQRASWMVHRPRLLPEGRCLRQVGQGSAQIQARIVEGELQHRVANLWRCNASWSCPWCNNVAALERMRRNQNRATYVEALTPGQGWYCGLATASHGRGHSLESSLDAITLSMRGGGGRRASQLADAFGVSSVLSTLEITYGNNGWHPHLHVLFRCHHAQWVDYWQEVVRRHRGNAAAHGRNVNNAANGATSARRVSNVVSYLSGFGLAEWSGYDKSAPFRLLKAAARGEQEATAAWLDFRTQLRGRHSSVWSGLGRECPASTYVHTAREWASVGAAPTQRIKEGAARLPTALLEAIAAENACAGVEVDRGTPRPAEASDVLTTEQTSSRVYTLRK